MQLLGGFLSPYVRRTAVSLNQMGLDWESVQVPVWDRRKRSRNTTRWSAFRPCCWMMAVSYTHLTLPTSYAV